ncbi:serine hydrolase [uncultured Corynebacterium sp.]|uniref:serine hydrolase n=1 Tax=uncultured Corynebacterium sp. TaxID=159447 RepID=UPI0025DD0DC7|nr:serine hydrolase [uncultured Corynebacterium sp.]
MFTSRFPGRRYAAASACAALLITIAPAAALLPDPIVPPASAQERSASKSASTSPTTSDRDDEKDEKDAKGRADKDEADEKDDAEKDGDDEGRRDESGKSGTNKSDDDSDVDAPVEADVDDDAIEEPTTDVGREIRTRMDEATETVADNGGSIGMAFLDRETGELVCNEQCLDSFALASLSKVFIAEVVGYTNYERPDSPDEIEAGEGDMPVSGNADAMLRDDMIRYSDNEATNSLWARYGGTEIIDNVSERYGLSDATRPNPDWGSTKSSAADLVTFFDGLLAGEGGLSEVETRYLVQLMYSLPRYSYGSADQNIGLRAALPNEFVGVKGGWYDPEIRTSAGFFGEDDRYVMAVLAHNVSPNDFTDAIAHVFPEGGASVEDRGDEAIRQAGTVGDAGDGGGSPVAPWIIALFVVAVAGFGLGWVVRR